MKPTPIPPLSKQSYLKKPTRCPFCRSQNIEGKSVDVDNGKATQEVWCVACGKSWRDTYKLIDVESLS